MWYFLVNLFKKLKRNKGKTKNSPCSLYLGNTLILTEEKLINTLDYQQRTQRANNIAHEKGGTNNRFIPIVFLCLFFALSFLFFTQKAQAFELEVIGLDTLDFSSLAGILGKLFVLFILFLVTKYVCKIMGINFPACILPNKRQTRKHDHKQKRQSRIY